MALSQAHERAGRFSIDLVPMNDASPATGNWSPSRVEANAHRAAADRRTIAYLGDLNSGATELSVPITNREGILQVSPASTAIALTEPDAGDPGSPGRYYPTGVRTFARVVQNDSVQAQALLLYMKQHGVTDVFVVHDRRPYGRGLAHEVEQFSERKGVSTVGDLMLGRRPDIRGVASSVASSGAQAVLFAGTVSDPAAPLFRDIHRHEPAMKLFAPDGLAAPPFTKHLGRAAGRTFVTAPARRPGTYPPSGERFFAGFRDRYGRAPNPFAIYAYEAMKALLYSIREAGGAHANRGRVADAFFGIRNRHSPLGVYSIRPDGDTSLAYYGGYRVRRGKLVYNR
jgi:branched-chain amino acid transport system substrate-binding protein